MLIERAGRLLVDEMRLRDIGAFIAGPAHGTVRSSASTHTPPVAEYICKPDDAVKCQESWLWLCLDGGEPELLLFLFPAFPNPLHPWRRGDGEPRYSRVQNAFFWPEQGVCV